MGCLVLLVLLVVTEVMQHGTAHGPVNDDLQIGRNLGLVIVFDSLIVTDVAADRDILE